MPFPVENLIEDRPEPVTIGRDESVSDALELMIENDFSQLPVIDGDSRPIGLVTYERILRGVRNFRTGLDQLHVRDVMSGVPTFDLDDDLFDLLEQLKIANAVLITDGTEKLVGIVTSYDSNEYFRSRAENLMHVEDIEVAVKEFILLAYTGTDGEIDERRLGEASAKVSKHGNNGKGKSFDELSLAEYISILGASSTRSFYEPIFQMPWKPIYDLLDDIRQTRNQLAHFKSEISASQTDQLRFCADWLARCREHYDQLNSQVCSEDSDAVVDDPGDVLANVALIAEETQPRESKYIALADWLRSQSQQIDRVDLEFDKIEDIIGSSLPASARKHRAWWANDSHSHANSQAWLDVGWRRSRLSLTDGHVSFVRMRDREKAYINFFSVVRAELEEKADFSIRDGSPDGSSWDTWQAIQYRGPVPAYFTMSFSHQERFRVELYIDTGSKETTKQIFDYIHSQKTALERELGQITWERIDKKRASRIALYHRGSITDEQAKLCELQDWAVSTAIAFYHALMPVADIAVEEVLGE